MGPNKTFTAEEAAAAVSALRAAIKLPPQQFAVQQLVGMISDEVEQLRTAGFSDEQIAAIVNQHAASKLSAAEIAEHYASPEQREGHHP